MYTTDINKIKEQLNHVLAMIDPVYIDALSTLNKKLAKAHIDWAIGGDLGEALRTVQTQPDCIEIVTDKKGASQIFLIFKDLCSKGVFYETQKLDRTAIVVGKEYPVYLRSNYFDFKLGSVKVKVYGDMQLRIGNWEWGDILQFVPEHICVVGTRTAIVPLQVKYEIYQGLGWTDRADKIKRLITKHTPSIEAR
jgi:hypothetical protein